jgi:hypothetical protein
MDDLEAYNYNLKKSTLRCKKLLLKVAYFEQIKFIIFTEMF